jgi:SSS family solute:Na+ symporter
MPKAEKNWSQTERESVQGYKEYQGLRTQYLNGVLPPEMKSRYDVLDNLSKRGELQSEVSYLDGDYRDLKKLGFIAAYSLIIGIYIIVGGLRAAATTNAIQGLMIIVMSLMMIPLGLREVGGFGGLHQKIPDMTKFWLAGSAATSEYTWYTILAIIFSSFVQMLGLVHNMSASGSAKDEDAARFGMLSGGFTKRVIIIAWMFCALIGLAMFGGNLSDPDKAWGAMSLKLLGPGLLGLMLSGIVLGHMPAVALAAVSVSGLIARNVYEPLVKGKSVQHYLLVGQIAIAAVLILSTLTSMASNNLLNIVQDMILFNTYFGAVVFLIFFWRRLTAGAIWIGLIVWLVLIGIVPQALPSNARRLPSMVVETLPQHTTVKSVATTQDVAEHLAQNAGEPIVRSMTIAPAACFFERVARVDPSDPTSPKEGIGRFNVEVWLISLLGVPVQNFPPAGLRCTRWLFDGLLPFVMLLFFSFFTPRADPLRVARFQAKMKTPVAPTPELDHEEVEKSYAEPSRFDYTKLMPGTNWEFTKWTRKDYLGFGGCWLITLAILGLLWLVVNIGA